MLIRKDSHIRALFFIILAVVFLAHGAPVWAAGNSDTGRVSRFGDYHGYSPKLFNAWVRQSQYVTMDDGVRLAVDIVRPAVHGKAVDTPFPVVVTFSRYQRNPTGPRRYRIKQEGGTPDNKIISNVDHSPMLQALVTHGYVVASVAVRGSGASFGRQDGAFSARETKDSDEVIEWLAKQPWSTGKVGMYGESYLGVTQYMAASGHPPALKAIVPDVAPYDLYDTFYDGGIYRNDYINQWGSGVRNLDWVIPPVPVDNDPDGKLLREAIRQHHTNWQPDGPFANNPYRDDAQHDWNWKDYGVVAVIHKLDTSGVAIYHTSGWYDCFVDQAPYQYLNYPGPERMMIGPWGHDRWNAKVDAERSRINTAEHLRWFDYWLKGIKNGVMKGDKVNYAIVDIPGVSWKWASSPSWPIPGRTNTTLYFSGEHSKSIDSTNDGSLNFGTAKSHVDKYLVDLTTTTGTHTRWDNASSPSKLSYPDMRPNDRKSLTYTTAPLSKDMTVVGYPMVKLLADSSKADGDFHILLEEVDSTGRSWLVTEGQLRLSMRKYDPAQKASWHDGFWRRQFKSDVLPVVPDKWYPVDIQLLPTGYLFNKGNRIRVVVMGADKDNTVFPLYKDAVLGVKMGGRDGSRIILPILK